MIGLAFFISLYLIFKKMGVDGYKAFVPFYNKYLLYKHGYRKDFFWVILGLEVVAIVLFVIFGVSVSSCSFRYGYGYYEYYSCKPNYFCLNLALAFIIATAVIELIARYSIIKSFGKSTGLAILSLFLGEIAFIIIGFDKEFKYTGNWYEERLKKETAEEQAV